jgi:hypothetical protein
MRAFLDTWLGRHLAWFLAVKFAALAALWAAFFSEPVRADGDAVVRVLVAPPDAEGESTR